MIPCDLQAEPMNLSVLHGKDRSYVLVSVIAWRAALSAMIFMTPRARDHDVTRFAVQHIVSFRCIAARQVSNNISSQELAAYSFIR